MDENVSTVMQDPDLDVIPPDRAMAVQARQLLQDNPAFAKAGADLTKSYMKNFCELSPTSPNGSVNPHFELQCMRANIMLNVIGDVLGHLVTMADHHKVDDDRIKRTMGAK